MKKDPQAALDTLLKYQDEGNYPLNPEIEKASMEILLPLMESDEQAFLTVNEQSWTDTIDWLDEQGLLENEIGASDILALQGE